MLIVELKDTTSSQLTSLADNYPELITISRNSGMDGAVGGVSLLITALAFTIPEIRKVVIEVIRARTNRSITFKGVKLQGYSAEEAEKIISQLPAEKK